MWIYDIDKNNKNLMDGKEATDKV